MDADYTSQSCPHCGHTSNKNRPNKGLTFHCENCGFNLHADLVGARNIAMRTLLVRQDWTSTGSLSACPDVSSDETKAMRQSRGSWNWGGRQKQAKGLSSEVSSDVYTPRPITSRLAIDCGSLTFQKEAVCSILLLGAGSWNRLLLLVQNSSLSGITWQAKKLLFWMNLNLVKIRINAHALPVFIWNI